MDLKEILPFIIVIAISIIGSLTKKKKQAGGDTKKKNIFETFMDELNGNNSTEVHEQTQPIFEVDDTELEQEFLNYEEENTFVEQEVPPANKEVEEPVSLIDHFNERQKKNDKYGTKQMTVIDIDENENAHSYHLDDVEEARKAILYSEIIKPRYL